MEKARNLGKCWGVKIVARMRSSAVFFPDLRSAVVPWTELISRTARDNLVIFNKEGKFWEKNGGWWCTMLKRDVIFIAFSVLSFGLYDDDDNDCLCGFFFSSAFACVFFLFRLSFDGCGRSRMAVVIVLPRRFGHTGLNRIRPSDKWRHNKKYRSNAFVRLRAGRTIIFFLLHPHDDIIMGIEHSSAFTITREV